MHIKWNKSSKDILFTRSLVQVDTSACIFWNVTTMEVSHVSFSLFSFFLRQASSIAIVFQIRPVHPAFLFSIRQSEYNSSYVLCDKYSRKRKVFRFNSNFSFVFCPQDIQEIDSSSFHILDIQVKWTRTVPYVISLVDISLQKVLSGHHYHFIMRA